MILAAHQPQFMPWLGYFDKMRRCDVFILLDDVQFKKNEWQNRNRVWSPEGWKWLTVPVLQHFPQGINTVRINNSVSWRDKHLKTLSQSYRAGAHYGEFSGAIEEMYSREWDSLCEINLHSIEMLRKALGVGTRIELSSKADSGGRSTLRLVKLCREFGADTYLAGAGGKDYMDMDLFKQAGIKVVFQEYSHPVYPQPGKTFIPGLSALDIIFNCGSEAAGIF